MKKHKQGKGRNFAGQQSDEDVLYIFHTHPIVMRKGIIVAGVMMVLGVLPSLIWVDMQVLVVGGLVGLALGSLAFFHQWIGWYFSVCIVTNKRIRQISQKGLFKRSIIDVYLKRIHNINLRIGGITETIFGFGTIVIQTIVGDMVLDYLPHPERRYSELLEALQGNGVDIDDMRGELGEEE